MEHQQSKQTMEKNQKFSEKELQELLKNAREEGRKVGREETVAEEKKKKMKNIKGLTAVANPNLDDKLYKETTKKLRHFKKMRKEQYDQAMKIFMYWVKNPSVPQILIAEEKTGKRIIAEIIHLLYLCWLMQNHKKNNEQGGIPNKDLIYIPFLHVSGHHRRSCLKQHEEMRKLGLYAESSYKKLRSEKIVGEFLQLIQPLLAKGGRQPLIMIDEADYASGRNMIIAPFVKLSASKLYISATPEEVQIALKNERHKIWIFNPAPSFHGKAWFLDENLIKKPFPFITTIGELSTISEHGKEIIYKCFMSIKITPYRNMIKIRLPGAKKKYKIFKENMKKNPIKSITFNGEKIDILCKFIDQGSSFEFDNSYSWKLMVVGIPILMFLCEKCKRSTELAQGDPEKWENSDPLNDDSAHSRLFAAHDARQLKNSNYNTLSQAGGRENHYHPEGHRIYLYMDRPTVERAAGRIGNDCVPNLCSRSCGKKNKKNKKNNIIWAVPFDENSNEEYGFSNWVEIILEGKKRFGSFNPIPPEKRTQKDGCYLSQVRHIKKVWTRTDKKQMESGIGASVPYRILAIYNDKKDPKSLRWNIIYERTRNGENLSDGSDSDESVTKYNHTIKKGKRGSVHTPS